MFVDDSVYSPVPLASLDGVTAAHQALLHSTNLTVCSLSIDTGNLSEYMQKRGH